MQKVSQQGESCWINRHPRKYVDLAIRAARRGEGKREGQGKEKERTRGIRRSAHSKRETQKGRSEQRECPMCAASNYGGYNGIICLRIVAAKHCCAVKCSTTGVHRAYREAYPSVLFRRIVLPRTQTRTVHPLDSVRRYTHTQTCTCMFVKGGSCAMYTDKHSIF